MLLRETILEFAIFALRRHPARSVGAHDYACLLRWRKLVQHQADVTVEHRFLAAVPDHHAEVRIHLCGS
jgi:hypothetical protein